MLAWFLYLPLLPPNPSQTGSITWFQYVASIKDLGRPVDKPTAIDKNKQVGLLTKLKEAWPLTSEIPLMWEKEKNVQY